MIKNILFDLGNVLIDVDIRKTLRAFGALLMVRDARSTMHSETIGREDDRLEDGASAYRSEARNTIITAGDLLGAGVSRVVAKYQVGEISTEEFINTVLTACKPGTTRQDVIDAWMAMLIGIPEARHQKLMELHKAGYKLYVLSNINEMHVDWTKEQLKDIPFEQMFFSNEIHLAKPDRRCYELVISETGIKPEETLYIDDLPANIEAGQRAGFECFLNTHSNEWTAASCLEAERRKMLMYDV